MINHSPLGWGPVRGKVCLVVHWDWLWEQQGTLGTRRQLPCPHREPEAGACAEKSRQDTPLPHGVHPPGVPVPVKGKQVPKGIASWELPLQQGDSEPRVCLQDLSRPWQCHKVKFYLLSLHLSVINRCYDCTRMYSISISCHIILSIKKTTKPTHLFPKTPHQTSWLYAQH